MHRRESIAENYGFSIPRKKRRQIKFTVLRVSNISNFDFSDLFLRFFKHAVSSFLAEGHVSYLS